MTFKVHTKTVQLDDVKIGDFILSSDTKGNNVFCEVLNKFLHRTKKEDLRSVQVGIDELIMSNNHPMWDPLLKEWLVPDDLGSRLTEHGDINLVQSARACLHNDEDLVDLHVAVTNAYFAGYNELYLQHNSATINFPFWHYQIDDLIVLKNNQGTEENRIRHLDYCVVVNALLWRKFKNKENITFFDPHEVPDLYEAFYRNTELFEELYSKYEKQSGLRTKVLPAETFVKDMLNKERTDTGRYYILNIDNVMNQGSYDSEIHPVYQTNLCTEVVIPTVSIGSKKKKIIKVKKDKASEFLTNLPTGLSSPKKI